MVTRHRSTDSPVLPSAEQLLKPWFEHLHLITLHLLRKARDVQDQLVSLVEQFFTDLLLDPVSPGTQLRVALKHIQASSNRLRNRIRLELTCTSLLICAYFNFAISHFPNNINFLLLSGNFFPFPLSSFHVFLTFTCMISTIATRSATEIWLPTMNGLSCRKCFSSRLSDCFRSSKATSIFSFGASEPIASGNSA